ncbi:hypothetical protein CS542_00500 [Pedobacter sp. IW39]|nr:hypothetical protein CS542_00500 [Pedobacter sp. IW39]
MEQQDSKPDEGSFKGLRLGFSTGFSSHVDGFDSERETLSKYMADFLLKIIIGETYSAQALLRHGKYGA